MSSETRIWWNGNEVSFIRWTEKGVVFNWGDPHETAMHLPRGTVARLVEKGVMQIQGHAPIWAHKLIRNETPRPKPAPSKPVAPKNSKKISIIARLINKLSGEDPVPPVAKTGAAAPDSGLQSARKV